MPYALSYLPGYMHGRLYYVLTYLPSLCYTVTNRITLSPSPLQQLFCPPNDFSASSLELCVLFILAVMSDAMLLCTYAELLRTN